MRRLFTTLSKLDAYPKSIEENVKTIQGAAITIICVSTMSLLIWIEFLDYLSPTLTEELFVDTSRDPNLEISLDITFPTISCDYLSLDAMDASGDQHLQIEHTIYKRRLDLDGNELEEPKKEDITIKIKEKEVATTTNKTECGSCYGAALDPLKCCNTCEDVREAYRERRWAFPDNPENIVQCRDEKFNEKLSTAFKQGCQIYGTLVVNRVSGSFHVAPGHSFTLSHVHVHDVQPFASTSFNTSHKIQHVVFGPYVDSETHNPLKNTKGVATEGATMFQYYIKIVPTIHKKLDGSIMLLNQYSVTKHQKVVSVLSGESGMPGAFFQYELSPLMVKRTEGVKSLGHFATNVCAIVGGVYTVAWLIDSLLYNSVKLMRKMELGKLQ